MKIRMIVLLIGISLLLGGCGWMDGSYVSVTPHQEQAGTIRTENLSVSNIFDNSLVMLALNVSL